MKKLVLVSLVATTSLACGSKRGSDGPHATTEPGTIGGGGGSIGDNAPDVSGKVFVGSTDVAAKDYEVWVVDHTAHDFSRHRVTASGTVTIPLDAFVNGDVYSFHLLGEERYVGTYDLSPSLAGVQDAVTYQGGYGFSLGEQVLAKDQFGRLDVPAALTAQVGGSFSVAVGTSGAFDAIGVPPQVESFAAGSQLLVYDPLTLLNGFYNRQSNPSAHAAALGSLSRVTVRLAGASASAVTRAFALDSGSWLATSRLAASDEQGRSDAPLWSSQSFELTAQGTGGFAASVFTGAPLDAGAVLALKAQPESGKLLDLVAYFARTFKVPPLVTAISVNGGTPAAIAYASTTAENGLTRPFCHTSGDVVAAVAMPLDQDGQAWSEAVAPYVDATFEYLATASGKSFAVTPAATDFAGSYAASFSEQAGGGGFLETWDPATRTLRLTAPQSAAAAGSHTVTLPAELLPTTAAGSTVSLVRVKLVVRWKDKGAESGAVLWLKKGC